MFLKAKLIIYRKIEIVWPNITGSFTKLHRILETSFVNIVTMRNGNLKNYLYPFEINCLNDIILHIKIN